MESMDRAGLKEDKRHGSPSFPMGIYPITRSSEMILHYHWHDECEILHMEEGSARIQVEGYWHRLEQGMAMLIPGGRLHSGYSNGKKECRYIAIVFNPVLATVDVGPIHTVCVMDDGNPWQSETLGHVRSIVKAMTDAGPGHRLMALGHLLQALGTLQGHMPPDDQKERDPVKARNMARFTAVLNHIHANHGERLSIADLRAVAGLSPYHFCRFFKAMSGRTPMEYVNMYRVEKAATLLATTMASVMDTAFDCGFENLSYFIKVFRRHQGCTPTEYRRRRTGKGSATPDMNLGRSMP